MAVLVNMENPTTTLRFGAPGESWRKSAQIPLVRDLELESEGLALEDLGTAITLSASCPKRLSKPSEKAPAVAGVFVL